MKKYVARFFLMGILVFYITGCHDAAQQVSQNPYKDDYTKIASLKNRNQWNGANVHDPTCIKVNDTYYLYSTDAYYIPPNINFKDDSLVSMGYIPVRSSKDLVHWNFEGWVFDSIPYKAFQHVKESNNGKSPDNIWAPFIREVAGQYRLYYSVSSFGSKGSCIGLAISSSPMGPWTDKGIVVKTTDDDNMNAIDPTVITDSKTGRDWMIYGSYFGGLYCLELNPATGKSLRQGDLGKCVARRAEGGDRIIEAPEIIYNSEQDMYYLFISYDPLFTFYNIRVGRSSSPEGPFLDYFGKDLKDTANNYPILTHSYMFNKHMGWSGNGHCAVLQEGNRSFVMHQGRLAPANLMLQLMVREVKWLKNGWPVVSPERYNSIDDDQRFGTDALNGNWEIIELKDIKEVVELWQGQLPPGGWKYTSRAFNRSSLMEIKEGKVIKAADLIFKGFNVVDDSVEFIDENGQSVECKLYAGWDWENKCETILFSGIMPNGHGVWGKKVKIQTK